MKFVLWYRLGCVALFLGVALGAFGAHGLKTILSDTAKATFETGVRYQMIHGLALFIVAWAGSRSESSLVPVAGVAFSLGILLFSGSLYLLSVTGVRQWGAVTPLGGLAFLTGWVALIFAAI